MLHDCSEEVILTLPTKQNRKWQRSRRLPPRHPSKAMDEDRGHRLDDRRGRRLGWGLGRGGGGGRGERRNGRSVVAPAAGEGPPRQTRPAPIVGKWVEIGLRFRPERRRFGADRTDRSGGRRIQTRGRGDSWVPGEIDLGEFGEDGMETLDEMMAMTSRRAGGVFFGPGWAWVGMGNIRLAVADLPTRPETREGWTRAPRSVGDVPYSLSHRACCPNRRQPVQCTTVLFCFI